MTALPTSLSSARLKRLAGYFSWSLADQVILLGFPKLILFPVLAHLLGEGAFGSLVVALGLIQLVGLAPSNGLVGFVIRDLVRESPKDQGLLLRTALALTGLVVVPFSLAFVFCARPISGLYDGNHHIKVLLPFLGAYLLFTNFVETALSGYRVRRRFDLISLVHGLQSAALFLAIPLYLALGIAGVGLAHLLAPAAALILVLFHERETLLMTPFFSRQFARAAMRVWPAFSLSALIALSAGYLDRILLGYWWSPVHVEPFFAAVTTASMIAIPATIVSNLTFSILGQVKNQARFDRGFYGRYGAAVAGAVVAVFVVGQLIGEFLLRLFYPRLADAALPLWSFALSGFALLNVAILLRPFISKFMSPAALPLLSFSSLVARVVPLILLVPAGGPRGAAMALMIGGAVTGLLWFGLYLRSFLHPTVAAPMGGVPRQTDEPLPGGGTE